jgi:hypothetical protein
MKYLLILTCLLFGNMNTKAQSDTLTAAMAKDYLGKVVLVKDRIVGARLFERPDKTTFLINLAVAYPNTPLTVVLYNNQYKELEPKDKLENKNILVRGIVTLYNGKLQIVVEDLKNIRIWP